jgi:hypothetical protein
MAIPTMGLPRDKKATYSVFGDLVIRDKQPVKARRLDKVIMKDNPAPIVETTEDMIVEVVKKERV